MIRLATLIMVGAMVAVAAPVNLSAQLSGAAEPGRTGALNQSGMATVRVDASHGQICYDLSTPGLKGITAAHIHQGVAGQSGPPVVPLPISATGMKGCTTASTDLARRIAQHPSSYYVNVHTQAHPNGAVRGQLATTP